MRRSPPTRRVVQILDLLASRPNERLSNAQIATELGLDASTCLGILNELTESGYVVRFADRSFGLGARLIGIGRAARDSRPSIAHAQRALRDLVEQLDVGCTASTVIGDEIVVLEAERASTESHAMLAPGVRFPFAAPVGSMFAAWQGDDAVDRWMERAPVHLDPGAIERLRAVIDSCRRTGVMVQRLTDEEAFLHRMLPLFFDQYQRDNASAQLARMLNVYDRRDYLITELGSEDPAPLSVSFVCAPSFDARGNLELVIGAYLMHANATREEITDAISLVKAAANHVTAGIGGVNPWFPEE